MSMSRPQSWSAPEPPVIWIIPIGLFLLSAFSSWAIVRSWHAPAARLVAAEPAVQPSVVVSDEGSSFRPRPPHARPAGEAPAGMVWIPGGEFSMGTEDPRSLPSCGSDPMPDARPIHRVEVDGFWIDRTEVTNDQFAAFVEATGYVTVAERKPTLAEFPGAPPENLVAGSIVFRGTAEPVPLDDKLRWWSYVPGASWKHPEGPASSIVGRGNYPVVQVAFTDAEAYAKWAGKRLPTEAEWEFAARGGLEGQTYTWGSELRPGGRWMANIWQGPFPVTDSGEDGFAGIAPTAKFDANGYGLYDMAGNVWEWCADWYRPDTYAKSLRDAPLAVNPKGPDSSVDPAEPGALKRVQRGGSYLCTAQYCSRYMVGTRGKGEISSASNHVGFRCLKTADALSQIHK